MMNQPLNSDKEIPVTSLKDPNRIPFDFFEDFEWDDEEEDDSDCIVD